MALICILITLIWSFYMSIEGVREGFYWRQNAHSNSNIKYNIHGIFLIQRIIVFLFILIILIIKGLIYYKLSLFIQGLLLISPFLHNGFYYLTRNWIDGNIYIKGFFDQSETSTAKTTKYLTPTLRIIYFIAGVILITTIIVLM